MTPAGRPPTNKSATLLIGVLVVVLLGVSAAAFFMSRQPAKNSNTNQASTNTAAPVEEPVNIGVSWPKFVSPYGMTALLPKGMTPCDEKNNTFSMRTDRCTDKSEPSFRFRRNAAWDSLDSTAAFNDAFAQELREAGLASAAGKTTSVSGTYVSALVYTFSDTLTGVIITELSPANGTAPRRVSVEVHRDRKPTAEGVVLDVDETLAAVIKGSRFSGQGVNADPETTSTN